MYAPVYTKRTAQLDDNQNTILNVKFKWNENEVRNSASHSPTSTRQSHAEKFMRLNVYEREKYICLCIDMLIDYGD